MDTARGHYPAPAQQQMTQSQYGAWVHGGHYYPPNQQQPHQPLGFNYYAPPPPQPPAPPQGMRFGGGLTSHVGPAPPPPPPPPPGETSAPASTTTNTVSSTSAGGFGGRNSGGGNYFPPLQPPPLPPLFPWMSPALAKSMTCSQYGQSFKEEASNLPFVPIIVNDADLAKMTENVIKEAEEIKSHQLQYYKDVVNQDLPKALKEMFQPLYCKLCVLSLSSPIVAKDHYKGKRHKKAVEAWFLKNPQLAKTKKHQNQDPLTSKVALPPNSVTNPGPINGFVTKLLYSNPNKGSAAPPQSSSSFGSGLPQQSQMQSKPPPLMPELERKRPAPPSVNQNQQKLNETKGSSNFTMPPHNTSNPNNNNARGGGGGGNNVGAFGPGNNNANLNPQKAAQGPSWQNNFSVDVPQAKRPRNDGPTEQPPVQPKNDAPSVPPPPRSTVPVAPGAKGLCQICNVQLSSQVMAEQHFKGKNHMARLTALQEQGGSAGVVAGGTGDVALPSSGPHKGLNLPNTSNQQKPFPPTMVPRNGGGGGGGGSGGPPPFRNNNRNNNNNNRNRNNNGNPNRNNNFNRFGNNNKGPRFN